MSELDVIRLSEKGYTIINPQPNQVVDSIKSLDGNDVIYLILRTPLGQFDVQGSAEGRIYVNYSSYDSINQSGFLVDESQPKDKEYRFLLGNGRADWREAQHTVPKSSAIEVLVFFLENNSLPIGLKWGGQIE